MADYFVQGSTFIPLKAEQIEAAKSILADLAKDNDEDMLLGVDFSFSPEGVCLYGEEYLDPEDLEKAVSALVEGLGLEGIFTCSWAYTCSKPRPYAFSGGAFSVARGMKTVWVTSIDL
jgi:hypothetical protein